MIQNKKFQEILLYLFSTPERKSTKPHRGALTHFCLNTFKAQFGQNDHIPCNK